MVDTNILPNDQNFYRAAGFESSTQPGIVIAGQIIEATGRVKVDTAGGGTGTVTSISSGTGILLTPDPITTTGSVALVARIAPIATLGTAGQLIRVNAGATALEYFTASAGGVASVVGTANRITVDSTDPANPIVNIAATYVGQTSITTLGTVTTGTLSTGTVLAGVTVTLGSDATGDIYYRNSGGVLTRLGIGSSTNVLTVAAGLPSWAAPAAAGTITVANEATDTTCFPIFVTAATGDLAPKSNAGLTFNSNTALLTATLLAGTTSVTSATIRASSNDSGSLGASGTAFSDLFLADGGIINWNAGNATITHSTGLLTVNVPVTSSGLVTAAGFEPTASTATGNRLYLPAANTLGFSINGTGEMQLTSTALSPIADGGNSLGTTALGWQNLFGNTGFVINIENSDWVATHTAGILTVGTGDLRVTTAGTNSASVVTVGGTQTLTAKTLTSPVINAGSLSGIFTLLESTSIDLDPAQSDQTWTGITRTGTAGAALAFGQLVYLAAADSRWELADSDSVTTSDRMLGIVVLAAAADGDPTRLLLIGNIRADSQFPAMTIGSAMYVGETAGAIQVAIPTGADNLTRRVGYALTADELYFNPSMDGSTTVA